MLTYGNHLGLPTEEIGGTGAQLCNLSQTFTHLALIDPAIALNAWLDRATNGRTNGRSRSRSTAMLGV